jgi:integrase
MSSLRKAADSYLRMRRGFGFTLYAPGLLLEQFIRFAEQEGAAFITQELALRWAVQPQGCSPAHWSTRLGVVRQFARHQAATDPRTEIPPPGVIPGRYRRQPPYVYDEKEILMLLAAARKLPSPTGLRARTYYTLFGLLAVAGMRVGEAVYLDRADVNLREDVLTLRHTKHGRPRWIPILPSTQTALRSYARRRDRICHRPQSPRFFVGENQERLTVNVVQWTFRQLSHQIGLRKPGERHGPRIHDLRHTFAVRTLRNWYRSGRDVERYLPQLATYLGHVHVSDTYWYLTGTPELLQWAAGRADALKERISL